MKLIIKQYLASLKERDELDIVLPDILSEVGYTVISRPKRGTRQYGVDVALLGPHTSSKGKALFLLSIKSGDLKRADWDTGQQALRPSLNEILDVYIPKHIPKRYQSLPIVIALCFGGDIQEGIRITVDSFIDANTMPGQIEFEEWNGDAMASLIATGLLREKIFPKPTQSDFRKAVAFIDEPDICKTHFHRVLRVLGEQNFRNKKDRLTAVRQIYLATWTVYVWCRDAKNLEAAYICSELAILWVWELCHEHLNRRSKVAKDLATVLDKTIILHRAIGATYIDEHITPFSKVEDGLARSVQSSSSLDINLKLFEALGRVAIHGLWLILVKAHLIKTSDKKLCANLDTEIDRISSVLRDMVNNNPVFYTPIRDDHAIEITLAGLFLNQCEGHEFLSHWIEQIAFSSIFSHRTGGKYPCILKNYADLADHPQNNEYYQKDATIGSLIYPNLAVWLAIFQDNEAFKYLSEFYRTDMEHSTWQLWLPDDTTDEHFYINSSTHGACFSGLDIEGGSEALLKQLQDEIRVSTAFQELSVIRLNLWPIALIACRTYRLPIPPHFMAMQLSPTDA